MTDHAMKPILALLAEGKHLPYEMAVRAFQLVMNGGATPAHMAALLMGLRIKGESIEEIAAGATAMRMKAQNFSAPAGAIDTCGTGGDARGTYNISTAVAFVLAACGIPVVKHGNRSVSSLSGSADVLEVLGVKVDAEIAALERCLQECGICFLFAPKFHTAMRHIAPVRQELGFRTIFNILGPLSNPAAPDFQLLGVYSPVLVEPMAYVLKALGTKAAWVVHGAGGLDELSLTGASKVAELRDGDVHSFEISPQQVGLEPVSLEDLKGKDPQYNAKAMQEVLSGMESAYRQAVLYNAAAGLLIAKKVSDMQSGIMMAASALDSGRAYALLKKLAEISHSRS